MFEIHRIFIFLPILLILGGCGSSNSIPYFESWNRQTPQSYEASQAPVPADPNIYQREYTGEVYQQRENVVENPEYFNAQRQRVENFANDMQQKPRQLPPVKVAILLPLSGQHAEMGQSMLQAAQLALFDMGYDNFELLPRDTKGTPQGATEAANASVNEGVSLILGPLFAASTKAAAPIAARRNINMISFSTDWTLAGENTFIMGFLPFAQVNRVVQYTRTQGIQSVGLIAVRDQYGNVVSDHFNQQATASGLFVADTFRFDPRDQNVTPKLKDFTRYSDDIEDEDMELPPPPFEAIFMPVGGNQAEIISNALSYYRLDPRRVRRIGTGLWDNPKLIRERNLQGAWFAAPSPQARKSFEDKYVATFGVKPLRLASLSYDATALAAVLAQYGFDRTGRPAFDRRSLSNPNGFSGIDGIFRFRPNGMVERGLAVLEIRNQQLVEIDPAPKTFQATEF